MIELGGDVYLFGGQTNNVVPKKSIYKLGCSNELCEFFFVNKRLKIARSHPVAIPVPGDFCDCC